MTEPDDHPSRLPSAAALDAVAAGHDAFGPGFGEGRWVMPERPVERLVLEDAHEGGRIDAFCAEIPPGGLVAGYLSYEMAAAPMGLSLPPAPDGLPLAVVTKYSGVAFSDPGAPVGPPRAGRTSGGESADPEGYQDKVARVIEHIRAGDIFQANLSRRLSAPAGRGGRQAFERLCRFGAAPYAAYLNGGDGKILSNSPELFLKVRDRRVLAEPIKGSRPRGETPETDRALAEALRADAKDRAENVMIADLLRNDLSKVCADGTVKTPAICALRTLPHIHHLYSQVTGTLRPGMTAMDALWAAFPCGSITGAPKRRAMEIIADLEGEGRGPYCGTIFVLWPDGRAIFSVPIRTAVIAAGALHVRTGGGITVLSDPAAEYEETVAKAYPFRALTA